MGYHSSQEFFNVQLEDVLTGYLTEAAEFDSSDSYRLASWIGDQCEEVHISAYNGVQTHLNMG